MKISMALLSFMAASLTTRRAAAFVPKILRRSVVTSSRGAAGATSWLTENSKQSTKMYSVNGRNTRMFASVAPAADEQTQTKQADKNEAEAPMVELPTNESDED